MKTIRGRGLLACGLLAAIAICVVALPRRGRDDRVAASVLGKHFDRSQVSLRIEKSKYQLTVLYRSKAVRSYPVVLGCNPVDDKLREGDGCTPEGTFCVQGLWDHKSWRR